MWFVLGALALIAVVVAAVSVLRRPSADDLSSVRHYHSALGTLEHLSERTGPSPAEAAGPEDQPVGPEPPPRSYRRPDAGGSWPAGPAVGDDLDPSRPSSRRSRPVPPASLRSDVPDPANPLVFDDARPQDRYLPDRGAAPPRSRMDRAQRHALDSMNHRPRRGFIVAAVVVAAVVLFGVLAFVGSGRSHPKAGTAATATTGQATATTSPSTTVGPSKHRKTTPTTAPAQIVALTSTASTALYPVGPAAYRLTISASGPCWVDASSPSTGSTLWTGTMQSGRVQQIQATGITRVELGTLAAALSVDGVPVVIPASVSSPFVATFEPIPPPAGAGSSSTTPTTFG